MKKKYFRFLSLAFFLVGIFFLLNSKTDITGAVVGVSNISSGISSIFGIVFILVSAMLFVGGESLEEKLEDEHHWKKYEFNKPFMMAEDVQKGYLKRKKSQEKNLTPIQERIERSVTGGKTIQEPYREHTYSEHHERESQGGRIIEVDSHIIHKGKYSGRLTEKIKRWWNRGKMEHFNKPAEGWYVWVVDSEGNFVVGDRTLSESSKYGHKLPHPVLANEREVYGVGEVFIKNGLVKEYNSGTGHYFDRRDPPGFDKQSKEVFEYFRKKAGWKEVRGGAKYSKKHDVETDSINY